MIEQILEENNPISLILKLEENDKKIKQRYSFQEYIQYLDNYFNIQELPLIEKYTDSDIDNFNANIYNYSDIFNQSSRYLYFYLDNPEFYTQFQNWAEFLEFKNCSEFIKKIFYKKYKSANKIDYDFLNFFNVITTANLKPQELSHYLNLYNKDLIDNLKLIYKLDIDFSVFYHLNSVIDIKEMFLNYLDTINNVNLNSLKLVTRKKNRILLDNIDNIQNEKYYSIIDCYNATTNQVNQNYIINKSLLNKIDSIPLKIDIIQSKNSLLNLIKGNVSQIDFNIKKGQIIILKTQWKNNDYILEYNICTKKIKSIYDNYSKLEVESLIQFMYPFLL